MEKELVGPDRVKEYVRFNTELPRLDFVGILTIGGWPWKDDDDVEERRNKDLQ